MRLKTLLLVCALALSTAASAESSRVWDRMRVDFNHPVVVDNHQTIPAGKYIFRELKRGSQPSVFEITDLSNRPVAVTAVPSEAVYETSALDVFPRRTQVVLRKVGNDEYLENIWFAGEKLGFHFDLVGRGPAADASGQVAATPATQEIVVEGVPLRKSDTAQTQNAQATSGKHRQTTLQAKQGQ